MTAQIVGFVTREEGGLAPPESISRNITPQKGGVAAHHGGAAIPAAEPGSDHALCVQTWRNWGKFHRSSKRNLVDIAYTGGYCQHGYAFAGRGIGVRTGANGTNVGNQNYYAIVFIGGEGQEPTKEAYDAFDWWIDALRRAQANTAVKPHKFFKPTGCPNSYLVDFAKSRDGQHILTVAQEGSLVSEKPKSKPKPKPEVKSAPDNVVKELQDLLDVSADGKWGPNTDARALLLRGAVLLRGAGPKGDNAIRTAQEVVGTKVDGDWGRNSKAAAKEWVKKAQAVLRVGVDGLWGKRTDAKFIETRRRYLNKF